MTKRITSLSIIALALFIFSSCHTSVVTPVKSNIENTWILMPTDQSNQVKWKFEAGKVYISVNDVPVKFDGGNGVVVEAIDYTVTNSITNHYVYLEPLMAIDNAYRLPTIKKYLVLTSKKDELFLESVGDNGHKGEYQLHFVY